MVPPLLSLNQVVRVPVAEYSAIRAQASQHVQKKKDGTEQGDTHAITANNAIGSDALTHVAPAPAFEKRKKRKKDGTEQANTHAITANNAVSSDALTHVAPAPAFEKRKKRMSSDPQKSATGSRQQDKSNQSNQHTATASSLNADEIQTSLPMSAAGPSRSPFMFMPAPTTFSYYPQALPAVYPGVVPTASSFTMPGRELFFSNTQPSHPQTVYHFTPYSLSQSSPHTSNIDLSTARYRNSDAIRGGEAGTPKGQPLDPLLGLTAPAGTSKV